jgi:hypothetical protein
MQMVGSAERFVIARDNNVVLVDFGRPGPPAPVFSPGAGGLRSVKGPEDEWSTWLSAGSASRQRVA